MTTPIEYALLAGASYFDTRHAINQFPLPSGWSALSRNPSDPSSGFEASAFKKGSEIVISYSGTDPNNAGLFSKDMQANLQIIRGDWTAQLQQAVEYYLEIKAANPTATITLTGHSLGGGLASLVAVFFGVSAQAFDQAPFAKSATALSDNAGTLLSVLTGKLDANGNRVYTAEALEPLTNYLELSVQTSSTKTEPVFPLLEKLIRLFLREIFRRAGTALMLGASVSACATTGHSWKEEVLLHDGQKIIAERNVERGGRREVGQQPPIRQQTVSFTMPGTREEVVWNDQFGPDLGTASFLPMLLDVKEGVAYIVAHPMGCLSYNKWGRPNPPYVVFKYQGRTWSRVAPPELPSEIKLPNLIFSSPDDEARNLGQTIVSATEIQKLYAGYRQPEYRSILREEIPNAGGERCGQMVSNGKGGWIGMGWFRDQPSHEACLNYCVREGVGPAQCPCEILFKGK